jgi:tape measure domain-containing protein
MPILSNLIVRIGASTDDFDKQVDRSLNKVKRFASDVTAAGTALSIGFSAPLIAAGAAAIKAGSDMESLTMGLKAVMKTSEATAAEMAKLRDVAKLPGLGLEEAVKGTIRLQILGNSANESRRIMAELGNALAVVGGGREDFNEVIRQLSQLGAVGKVTKENLDPIIERIPQLAAIIKEKFGAEALGDPAKTFEKLGISSQQFIQIITDELAKGERAGNTYKNSWENIEMAAKDAAAEFGKTLLPIAQRVLDEFLTPGIEKAKALAAEFRNLPQPAQDFALGLSAIAVAAPLAITGIALMIEKTAVITAALLKLSGIFGTITTAIGAWGLAAGNYIAAMAGVQAGTAGATAALGLFYAGAMVAAGSVVYLLGTLNQLWDAEKKVAQSSENMTFAGARLAEAIQKHGGAAAAQLRIYDGLLATGVMTQETYNNKLRELAKELKTLPPLNKDAGKSHEDAAKGVDLHAKAMASAKLPTMELLALFDMFRDADKKKSEAVNHMSEIMQKYEVVTVASALRVAKALDLLFVSYRQLSDAPDLGGMGIDFSKLPKAPAADLPGPGGFEDFVKGGRNIGPEGMMTKEQHAAITARMKDIGKVGKAAYQQVSTVVTDLSRGITDVIFKGGKLGDMLTNVAKQAAQSITRLLIEGALKKLTDKLFDVGGLMGKVFGGATSVGGSVFSAASSAGGSVAGAAGGASSGIGGAASAATSSLTGIVGAVGSVVSAVSGVIGNFQMSGMNKSLDLIVKHTLQTANDLANLRADSWMREGHLMAKLDDMWKTNLGIYDLLGRGAVAGGGASVVINLNGGDPKAALEEITRTLKQYGVIPRG